MKDETTLARWINNEMDAKELEDFQSSPDFATYEKIKKYSAQLVAPGTDIDAMYNQVASKQRRVTKVRTLNPWLGRIAAILIIALGITYFFYTTNSTMQMADAGQRKEFLLPDNSTVMLNAGSSAEYREWNWNGNRSVTLNGEAFFKVAKGEKFDVVTPQGIVTVVGTQFNVRVRGTRIDVTCFEGKVKVDNQKEIVLLTPGKSVAYENGIAIPVQDDALEQPGWLSYETKFTQEKLSSVIAEMQRQYKIEIKVKGQLPQKPFSGTLPMNNLNDALEILKATYTAYDLKSEKSGNTVLLSVE
ncbi:MAG: DUF4974 domain-containing protein [Flavobacterium sp.]|nr:MAG: DUF4974 domain-containing protein [Flavobacterium sp.]